MITQADPQQTGMGSPQGHVHRTLVERATCQLLVSIADKLQRSAIWEDTDSSERRYELSLSEGANISCSISTTHKGFRAEMPEFAVVEELKQTVKELTQLSAEDGRSENSQTT